MRPENGSKQSLLWEIQLMELLQSLIDNVVILDPASTNWLQSKHFAKKMHSWNFFTVMWHSGIIFISKTMPKKVNILCIYAIFRYILRTFPSEEKLCVIKYENLLSDLENTLKPCLKFLGYPLDSIGEFCLENENLEGNFHRPRRKPEEINEIMQLIPKAKWQEYEEIWSQNLANLLESSYKIK